MQFLTLSDSWKRRGIQLGLLGGATLAFIGGAEPPPLSAGPRPCQLEGECTFKKPRLAIVLESSTAMNQPFDADHTRWETATELVEQMFFFDNGYVAENYILGLLRFGHDPDPAQPGTTIVGDTTGLVDGLKLDVPWYDPDDPAKKYRECDNGDAIIAALEGMPAPLGGAQAGIGAWTSGALEFARSYYLQADVDHPDDLNKRYAALLVLTTGRWTDAAGALQQSPPAQDPTIVTSDLWVNHGVPTYVVGFGGPADKTLVDELAAAGGTTQALAPTDLLAMVDALAQIVQKIKSTLIAPVCTPGIGRVMVLLDASSSMLDGAQAGPGASNWDKVRGALAGPDAIFDLVVGPDRTADQVFHFGLSVFGGPGEQKQLVQYAPCREPNVAWALDPASACEAPGCLDPYAAPPIAWTFKDGSMVDPPDFASPTFNHMPQCDLSAQQPLACTGSESHPDLGLQLVHANLTSYRNSCLQMDAKFPCSENTPFINVLITDGTYDATDAEVQAPLTAMHAEGVITHVIGFGDDLDIDQLDKMAAWGSGDLLDPVIAQDQDELEAAFQTYLVPPVFDPCCGFVDCSKFIDTDGPLDGTLSEGDSETGDSETGDDSTGTTGAADTSGSSSGEAGTTAPIDSGAGSTSGECDSEACTGGSGVAPTTPTTSAGEPTGGPADDTGGPASDGSTGDSTGPGADGLGDRGCGCTGGDSTPPTSLLLLALLGLRRRRSRG